MLLFKRILDFKKTEGGFSDKRGAKRYPVGVKSALKAKLTLPSRDSDGGALPPETSSPMDWGGQLVNLSTSGASIRIHPAAIAKIGDACLLKIEIDNMIFELAASVAYFRITAQYVACGNADTPAFTQPHGRPSAVKASARRNSLHAERTAHHGRRRARGRAPS